MKKKYTILRLPIAYLLKLWRFFTDIPHPQLGLRIKLYLYYHFNHKTKNYISRLKKEVHAYKHIILMPHNLGENYFLINFLEDNPNLTNDNTLILFREKYREQGAFFKHFFKFKHFHFFEDKYLPFFRANLIKSYIEKEYFPSVVGYFGGFDIFLHKYYFLFDFKEKKLPIANHQERKILIFPTANSVSLHQSKSFWLDLATNLKQNTNYTVEFLNHSPDKKQFKDHSDKTILDVFQKVIGKETRIIAVRNGFMDMLRTCEVKKIIILQNNIKYWWSIKGFWKLTQGTDEMFDLNATNEVKKKPYLKKIVYIFSENNYYDLLEIERITTEIQKG